MPNRGRLHPIARLAFDLLDSGHLECCPVGMLAGVAGGGGEQGLAAPKAWENEAYSRLRPFADGPDSPLALFRLPFRADPRLDHLDAPLALTPGGPGPGPEGVATPEDLSRRLHKRWTLAPLRDRSARLVPAAAFRPNLPGPNSPTTGCVALREVYELRRHLWASPGARAPWHFTVLLDEDADGRLLTYSAGNALLDRTPDGGESGTTAEPWAARAVFQFHATLAAHYLRCRLRAPTDARYAGLLAGWRLAPGIHRVGDELFPAAPCLDERTGAGCLLSIGPRRPDAVRAGLLAAERHHGKRLLFA